MIPPLQPLRLRSIVRWLQGQTPTPPSAELDSRALDLDEQMIQVFEDREDAIKAQMMRDKTWGTAEGMQSFPRERLTLWSDVAAEFLPTTDPDPED